MVKSGLSGIRAFLQSKSCYDVLPESFRLIVFDNKLSITRSLQALVTNGVVSAPLYDSTTQRFAGMFTLSDVVHLIQYYYLTAHEYENVIAEVEAFQLESLRRIEQAIDVPPPPTVSVHPDQPLSDACTALVRTHARRLPLVDRDDQTGKETIISVLTQYRVLKFIAINCQHDCARLDQSIGSLGIGSYVSWYDPTGATPSTSMRPSPVIPISPLPEPDSDHSTPTVLDSNEDEPTEYFDPERLARDSSPASTKGDKTPTATPTTPRSRSRSFTREPGLTASTPLASVFPLEAKQAPPLRKPTIKTTKDRYHPLATATLETSVFDVVHIFSERGISAVPIVDAEGMVINLYETVDIVDLVRQNAYQVLDQTIGEALQQRASDFNGVITCTPSDTLASILAYVRERRVHRFVIVEEEDVPAEGGEGGRPARKKGSLVGILSLSDVLRWIVGDVNLKGHEVKGLGFATGEQVQVVSGSKPGSRGSSKGSRRGSTGTEGSATDADEGDDVHYSASELHRAMEKLATSS